MPTIEFKSGLKKPIGDVYCIGRNYAAHAKELNNPVPKEPMVFLKPASSIVADSNNIVLPGQSSDVHHEVEVCIILGKTTKRNMTVAEAENAIDGYAVGIDITARDIQQKAKEKGHPWSVAKGFATFAPISRFVNAGEVAHYADLSLELKINGEVRQQGNTQDMIFSIPYLISHLSGIFNLQAGDLVFTGTPEGVGPINDGDALEATLGDGLIKLNVKAVRE